MSKAWGAGYFKGERDGRSIEREYHMSDLMWVRRHATEIDGKLVGQCPFHSGHDGLHAYSRDCLFVYDPMLDIAECDCGITANARGLAKHIEKVEDTIGWRKVMFDPVKCYDALLEELRKI